MTLHRFELKYFAQQEKTFSAIPDPKWQADHQGNGYYREAV